MWKVCGRGVPRLLSHAIRTPARSVRISAAFSQENFGSRGPLPNGRLPFWAHIHVCMGENSTGEHGVVGDTSPYKDHVIANNTTYRLWNTVSKANGGLLKRDPQTNLISCEGDFDDPQTGLNTVVGMKVFAVPGKDLCHLVFRDLTNLKSYAVKANGKGKPITSEEIPDVNLGADFEFEPNYFWSYTMFKSPKFQGLYLGSDALGKTTLLEIGDPSYPNPQTLFITNQISLI